MQRQLRHRPTVLRLITDEECFPVPHTEQRQADARKATQSHSVRTHVSSGLLATDARDPTTKTSAEAAERKNDAIEPKIFPQDVVTLSFITGEPFSTPHPTFGQALTSFKNDSRHTAKNGNVFEGILLDVAAFSDAETSSQSSQGSIFRCTASHCSKTLMPPFSTPCFSDDQRTSSFLVTKNLPLQYDERYSVRRATVSDETASTAASSPLDNGSSSAFEDIERAVLLPHRSASSFKRHPGSDHEGSYADIKQKTATLFTAHLPYAAKSLALYPRSSSAPPTFNRRVSQTYCSTLEVLPLREKTLAFSSKPATYLANTFAQRTHSPYSNEKRKTQRARDVCNQKQLHSGDYTMPQPFRLSTPVFSDTFVDSSPPTKATRLSQSNSGHDDGKPCSLCQTNFRVRQRRSASIACPGFGSEAGEREMRRVLELRRRRYQPDGYPKTR